MGTGQFHSLYQSIHTELIEPGDARHVPLEGRAGISTQRAWAARTAAEIRECGVATRHFLAGTLGVGVSTAFAELAHLLRELLPVQRVTLDLAEATSADDIDRMLALALGLGRGTPNVGLTPSDQLRFACAPYEGGLIVVDRRDVDVFAPPQIPSPAIAAWVERRMTHPLDLHFVAAMPIEIAPWATPRLPIEILPALPVVGVDGSLRHASFSALRQMLAQRVTDRALHDILSPTDTLRVLEASGGSPGELFELVLRVIGQHAWQPLGAVDRAVQRRRRALAGTTTGAAARILAEVRAGEGLDVSTPERVPVVASLLRSGAIQAVATPEPVWAVHPLLHGE